MVQAYGEKLHVAARYTMYKSDSYFTVPPLPDNSEIADLQGFFGKWDKRGNAVLTQIKRAGAKRLKSSQSDLNHNLVRVAVNIH
jgi:hypothetical protein